MMDALRYGIPYIFPLTTCLGVLWGGVWAWLTPLLVFGLVPVLELILPVDRQNLDEAGEAARREDPLFDAVLFLSVPLQYLTVGFFLWQFSAGAITDAAHLLGAIGSVGLCCGAFGINAAHELGHRRERRAQLASKALLVTSLYAHFFIEHNRGHHVRVATPEDPASSRRGETLYAFWLRSVVFSHISAWKLERDRLAKKDLGWLRWDNQWVRLQAVQIAAVAAVALTLGPAAALAWAAVATLGALLLETVNYIEHYGLSREKNEKGRYERVRPEHSWNADHVLGRLLLFELTRHSDHHANAGRPYPVLRHFDDSPQLPTGYPGMMLLATLPPLFFSVMHAHIDRYEQARLAA